MQTTEYEYVEIPDTQVFCSMLGLPNMGYYEIFNYFFISTQNLTDEELYMILDKAFIQSSSQYCFCLKLHNTFCWFTVTDKVNILGKLQFSTTVSLQNIGAFIKQLRFSIVKSGIRLDHIKFLVWDDKVDLKHFENYIIQYDNLQDFFNKIQGCSNLSYKAIIQLLQKEEYSSYNAEAFVRCLKDNFEELGLYEQDGILYSTNLFYHKDYVGLRSPIIDPKNCSYGIILDTEGKGSDAQQGVREIGGIIYCRNGNRLTILDTFYSDSYLAEDVLKQAMQLVKSLQPGHIRVHTYGDFDRKLLYYSISDKTYKQLSFHDISTALVVKYNNGRSIKQSKLAEKLGVLVHKPKHSALADAKTLFNILAVYTKDFSERSFL